MLEKARKVSNCGRFLLIDLSSYELMLVFIARKSECYCYHSKKKSECHCFADRVGIDRYSSSEDDDDDEDEEHNTTTTNNNNCQFMRVEQSVH